MNDKLNEALNHISDEKLAEAAGIRKRRSFRWVAAVAAVLVIVLVVTALLPDAAVTASAEGLIASPVYPKMAPYPDESKYYKTNDWDAFDKEYSEWCIDIRTQRDQPAGYADSLQGYFRTGIPILLSGGNGGNAVCSPLNIYMALAMLAETTGGSSRRQILDALGADSIQALRTQAGQVWNAHYMADSASTSVLANSLWLESGLQYNTETVRTLADSYYASVYQGDLGSAEMNEALLSWLNEQTGGLLEDQVQNVTMPQETILALASTIYYRAKWVDKFYENHNTEDIFHTPSGDRTVTYMKRTLAYGPYYWGEDFGAVYLQLEDNSKMWLILPDEGRSPEDILASGHALELLLGDYYASENKADIKVHLSLPKFDVVADTDLNEKLAAMGITDVMGPAADFSPILPEDAAYLDTAKHAARVKIDEEGVEAAAYTVMMACGAAMPPEEEIDFILDRPFLFVITSHDNLPLFAGIVNEP